MAAREKIEIDSVVNKILEQDRQARREHYTRQLRLKEFMEKYLKEREDIKKNRRQKEKDEWNQLMVMEEK